MSTRAKGLLSFLWLGLIIYAETPLKLISLEYPRLALFAKIEGKVTLLYKLSADGSPVVEKVAGGNELLRKAAQQNFANWRFPIETRFVKDGGFNTIEYKFEIIGDCKFSYCPSEFQFTTPNNVLIVGKHPMLEP